MSLSFKDSLENNIANTIATVEETNEEIIVDEPALETATVRAYSLRSVMPLADEGWTPVEGKGYRFYNDEYKDEGYSTVDELKNIILDSKQFNITQERNSQYIPFQMPRYYDGFDLAKTTLSIYYVNSNKDSHSDTPVDVYFNDDYIRFAWLVSEFATQVAGILQFEIHATGQNSKNEPYTWKSKSIDKLNVIQSLEDVALGEIGVSEEELETWYNKIQFETQQAQQYASSAQTAAREAARLVAELQDGIADEVVEAVDNRVETVVGTKMKEQLVNYYTRAETYNRDEIDNEFDKVDDKINAVKPVGYATEAYVNDKLGNLVDTEGSELTVEAYVRQEVDAVDVSEELGDLGTNEDGTKKTVVQYVADAIAAEDITAKLGNYYTKSETYNKDEVDDTIGEALKNVNLDGYATEKFVTDKTDVLSGRIDTNKSSIDTLSATVKGIDDVVKTIDTSPNLHYRATYGTIELEDGSTKDNMFVLWQAEESFDPTDENDGVEKTPVSRFEIVGGGGGSGATSNKLYIYYDTDENGKDIKRYAFRTEDVSKKEAIIRYSFYGEDPTGSGVDYADAIWQIRRGTSGAWTKIATETVYVLDGVKNEFNVSEYISSVGTYQLMLSVSDNTAGYMQKTWTIQNIEFKIESSFDDTEKKSGNVQIDYIPYGAVEKDLHFKLYKIIDEEEVVVDSGVISLGTSSGIPNPELLEIPAQEHGSYLFEVYMTAKIMGNTVKSNVETKDIIWFDDTSDVPVIGSIYQKFTAKQYEKVDIVYTVYDPSTETPKVDIAVNGVIVSSPTLTKSNTDTYTFKTDKVGKHIITITCGETVKTLIANIVELGINVKPVETGLVFDFNPVGKSNNSESDKAWSYGSENNKISMIVSPNFDWVNGGYQYDENGDQYFCIKAGTSAEIDYKLFGDDAMANGKEMKLVFKTTNVSNPDATFLHCIDNTTDSDHIGIQMDVHETFIYGQTGKLHLPYSEEDIIEFEFNISKKTEAIPMVMGYEDGVSTCPMVYNSDSHSFTQTTKKVISLGSEDCDLHIYRFKVYNTSLSDANILNNFIADARNAEEMISRYNRNQIYDNGILDPDNLAEKCPWLRIIKIDCPTFTTGKKYPVNNTTIEYIYRNGEKDGSVDYWKCVNGVHVGQGTSSDNYGAAGRNLDLVLKSHKDFNNSPVITLKDGTIVEKVALTQKSVPANYFNCKVNIASSENANNALLQRRYNTYNPYNRAFVREDGYDISIIKDTMEFYNCVIFVKENSTDLSAHTEFADNEWHFYAIGNIGDSKKTDKTRLTDPNDRYECINEIIDVEYPLSDFPMGDEAIAIVEAEKFDKSGTYEWRYIWEDGTEEENAEVFEYCKQRWIDFYKKVVEPLDYSDVEAVEKYKKELAEYVVLDSVLYYYLFTTRYTMVDNRAKNSFWHYGKTGEIDAEGNPIRKWDLAFDYDNDTALGINNYGDMVYRYGLEDTHVDENGVEIFRESDSTFFCRLRDLFKDELKALYQTLETNGAWHADGLITQFDEWQNEFPEELWRKDIERKYIRTYTSSHINGAPWTDALVDMAHGRKKYQRRQFERNQEKYMASKYQSSVAASDENSIVIRCGKIPDDKLDNLVVQPNYSLTLTPYAYMYLNVEYSNGVEQVEIKELGEPVTVPFKYDSTDIIKVYSASSLQSVGDLSPCYARTINAASATKLKELIIGNETDKYDNPYLTNLTTGANYLLEKLDIQNVSGLNQALNLQAMNNLKELYAKGSNVTGVTFADGGRIEIAELPAINTLTMKNLMYLVNLDIADLTKLTRLRVENCSTVDLLAILNATPNLNRVRITGVNWELKNTSLLEKLYLMNGENKDGALTDSNGNDYPSVLTGKVYVDEIKERQLATYNEKWPDLEITYPEGGLIEQFAVTFVNADNTPLLNEDGTPMVQYVDVKGFATDPSRYDDSGNPIFPVIESDFEYDYIFSGEWVRKPSNDVFDFDKTLIMENITLQATYNSVRRTYGIKYVTKTGTITDSGLYGQNVVYDYEKYGIPYYTGQENANTFYLFSHWDKSGFLLEGENKTDLEGGFKVVNAVYDVFHYDASGNGLVEKNENPDINGSYTVGNFKGLELSDLSPVHIYALTKLGVNNTPLGQLQGDGSYEGLKEGDPYKIVVGNDFNFADIDSEVLISEKTSFGNSNYKDTNIQLFNKNEDFVLAIDYKFLGQKSGTLVQCLDPNGSGRGFKFWYDGSSVQFTYDEMSESITKANNHEMIVLRNAKDEETGEYVLSIYQSNLDGDSVKVSKFNRSKVSDTNASLIFGASFAYGEYGNYVDGDINWAKIWRKDLGDDACRSLAMWTRESIDMNVCGFKRYILTDNTKSSFSLLASHLLERTKLWNSSDNDFGWAGPDGNGNSLNKFLNNRLYNAMPIQIRYLLKPMIVWGNDGLGSRTIVENGTSKTVYYTDVTSSNCYITIPAIVELFASYQKTAPYNLEIQNGNDDVTTKTISYMVRDDDRIRNLSDGTPSVYWTRSPDIAFRDYVWCVDKDGKAKTISGTQPNAYSNGVLIEISF